MIIILKNLCSSNYLKASKASYLLKSGYIYRSCSANATPSAYNFFQSTSENKFLENHSALYKHLLKHQHKNVGLNIFRWLKINKNRRKDNIFEDELFQFLRLYANTYSLIGHISSYAFMYHKYNTPVQLSPN